ncbi:MAG: DUF1489 family protein [Alphaproteobacteria bacterium]|nr:MAG: DUF1489 family protein [Alphaproteobacteria bacterium]
MTLHLIKLCVGVDRLEQLQDWQRRRALAAAQNPDHPPLSHVTRMTPRRRDDVLGGGSLYWVIKGVIQVRQKILDLDTFDDDEGISRCRIVLDDNLVPTAHQPKRPFQGWRYLKPEDAPRDLDSVAPGAQDLPPEMRAELSELGLL